MQGSKPKQKLTRKYKPKINWKVNICDLTQTHLVDWLDLKGEKRGDLTWRDVNYLSELD